MALNVEILFIIQQISISRIILQCQLEVNHLKCSEIKIKEILFKSYEFQDQLYQAKEELKM